MESTTLIAAQIHGARPELPLIMRREGHGTLEGLSEPARRVVCAAYTHRRPGVTNLIWGPLKNRFLGEASSAAATQVPLIVNHKHKYISFGSGNPQLCFRFLLRNPVSGRTASLYTYFVFNLSWSPQDFEEIPERLAGLMESGELQLF